MVNMEQKLEEVLEEKRIRIVTGLYMLPTYKIHPIDSFSDYMQFHKEREFISRDDVIKFIEMELGKSEQ